MLVAEEFNSIELMVGRPAQRGAVHAFAQNFDGKLQAGAHVDVIFIILLQDALRRLVICPDGGSFPTAVVARWVRLEQLETKVLIPASDEK
jgi:hypothetical protein